MLENNKGTNIASLSALTSTPVCQTSSDDKTEAPLVENTVHQDLNTINTESPIQRFKSFSIRSYQQLSSKYADYKKSKASGNTENSDNGEIIEGGSNNRNSQDSEFLQPIERTNDSEDPNSKLEGLSSITDDETPSNYEEESPERKVEYKSVSE